MVRTVTPAMAAARSGGTIVAVASHRRHQRRTEAFRPRLMSVISSISMVISVRFFFIVLRWAKAAARMKPSITAHQRRTSGEGVPRKPCRTKQDLSISLPLGSTARKPHRYLYCLKRLPAPLGKIRINGHVSPVITTLFPHRRLQCNAG